MVTTNYEGFQKIMLKKKKKKKRLENNKIFNIINKKPRKKFAV